METLNKYVMYFGYTYLSYSFIRISTKCVVKIVKNYYYPDNKSVVDKKDKDLIMKNKEIIIDTTPSNKIKGYMSTLFDYVKSNPTSINSVVYEKFKKDLELLKDEPEIKLKIKTYGGSGFNAMLICNLIYHFKGEITCYIDEYAMSAGSLIAFSCNKIIMKKTANMGQVDAQISFIPINFLLKSLGDKVDEMNSFERFLYNYALSVNNSFLPNFKKNLSKNYTDDVIEKICDKFFFIDKHHSTLIFPQELDFLGKDKLEIVD